MRPDPFTALRAQWEADAETLRRRGATAQAEVLESVLADFDAAWTILQAEAVSLAEGARVSGYTADHLSRLMREGKLRNVGRPGAPRVRLTDLPRKPDVSGAPRQIARPRLLTEGSSR
jgi:hypothetical protein